MTTFEMPTVLVNPANMQRYIRDKGKSFLGSGSFGLCYRFREIARGREVAVKVSKKNTPKEHKKMRQEADINRLFRHENVIQMFDYFMDKGQMYIVLEYCSNNSLKELLNRRTTITEPECRYYIRQIVAGVEHIHSHKYVHRDLKLENVFLNEQLRAKIGDFGMSAKIRNDLPRKSFCGTPNYMAPEIVEEEAYYFEVDIWSIGCMFYALLYGKPPFAPRPNEHGLRGTYDRIQRVQYDLPADTPPATRALISALLQRVPSNRPNADQVLKFEFFNQPTPKWLPQTALCVEPDLSAMDFYETIKLQRLQHKQPNAPVRRPLAAINNHQPIGRQPQKQTAEDGAGKKTENGGKRLVEQMQMAMGELRIETNNTVRVVPSSTRRKTTLSQRRCNFEDHARILAVQLNGLVAKLRTAHNLPVEEMYRSRMQSPSCAPPIWITRWIARSDEFFAYSLSDKSHGAGFSDGSFMQLDKDLQRMTYIDQQLTEWPFLVAEDGDVPEALRPRVHQMWDVVDQLHGLNVLGIDKGNRQTAEEVDFLTREPVVRVWDIQAELAAMWLSNGLLQVNWRQGEERLKLFVCPLMQCVSFLDANQRFTTIKFDTLLTYGCAMKFRNYIEKLPDIVARLRQKHVDNQTRNAVERRCTETGCRGLKRNDCNDGAAQLNAVFPLEVGHRNSL